MVAIVLSKNNNPISAVIFGIAGFKLNQAEKDLFNDINPLGFILFARNIDNPKQLNELTSELRNCTGRENTLVLIDQEGGRVQRMNPPHWKKYPPQRPYGEQYINEPDSTKTAVYETAVSIANDLKSVGINVNCLPLLDVPVDGANDIIGDRAFSHNPEIVSVLGGIQADGLLSQKVLPVIKHIAGHGRALVDSHLDLPIVDTDIDTLNASDFIPFRKNNHYPLAMTAHIVYNAIDSENPLTHSKKGIDFVRNDIGFNGLIMTDDLSMKALQGTNQEKVINCLDAGCDIILHCNGEMDEMIEISSVIRPLTDISLQRLEAGGKTPLKIKQSGLY